MSKTIKTIIIGIVQGLTEFLPVSSSGHIRIFKELFGLSESGLAFDVMLHLGTLIAVCVFYRKDIAALAVETVYFVRDIFSFDGKRIFNTSRPYRILLTMMIITTVPTAVAGYFLEELFDTVFSSLAVVGIALIITALLMYITSYAEVGCKTEKDITVKDALIVGVCQSCALVPGLSRSGATIFGGRISGFDMRFAVKYSFLCSLPAVLGAIILNLYDMLSVSAYSESLTGYIGAFIASAVTGCLSLKLLDKMAKKKKLVPFACYCGIVGVICIAYGIFA